MMKAEIFDFYKGKKVLVTGHTGFKGTWLIKILVMAGADVTGYALEPPTDPSLFKLSGLEDKIHSVIGDIRDFNHLNQVMDEFQPEIVFHLAAQPIVLTSYKNPRYTYETNVMGTVNICEAVRLHESVKSFLNITTDKVYKNNEWCWGYREDEYLDGFDPYSNSKSCSELVTHSYVNSFFGGNKDGSKVAVSTARAGNVIGGGDFADNRIIPDAIRSMTKSYREQDKTAVIEVRNPYSTRPYQHVLEPLYIYLLIAEKQYMNINYAGNYNVGPDDCDCIRTGELIDLFCKQWNSGDRTYPVATWVTHAPKDTPHEANFLKLDCSKIKSIFDWTPRWHIDDCIRKTVDFTKVLISCPNNLESEMENEINDFFKLDD